MSSTIRVAVRSRPLTDKEMSLGHVNGWKFTKTSIASVESKGTQGLYNFGMSPSHSVITIDFVHDHTSSNKDIYAKIGQEIILSVMNGFNGTIFAYGQTGSGKTFTMLGNEDQLGVIPLSIKDIFSYIQENSHREFLLRVSYMEIYNEIIKDLLNPLNSHLKIHETPLREIFVGNLTETVVTSESDIIQLMNAGEKNRHIGETNANEKSSRSHTIFRMIIESRERSSPIDAVKISTLNLVDLAGSERVGHTGAEGIRLKEGGHINKSLLALGTVIAKLSDESDKGHIPFRDSKLTRILQPALGGNSKTAIICTITPSSHFMDESVSTLKFASRAKTITTKPEMNEIISDQALLRQYRQEIGTLKRKLDELTEAQNASSQIEEKIQKFKSCILNSDPSQSRKLKRRQTWFPGILDPMDKEKDDKMKRRTLDSMDIKLTRSFSVSAMGNTSTHHVETQVQGDSDLKIAKQRLVVLECENQILKEDTTLLRDKLSMLMSTSQDRMSYIHELQKRMHSTMETLLLRIQGMIQRTNEVQEKYKKSQSNAHQLYQNLFDSFQESLMEWNKEKDTLLKDFQSQLLSKESEWNTISSDREKEVSQRMHTLENQIKDWIHLHDSLDAKYKEDMESYSTERVEVSLKIAALEAENQKYQELLAQSQNDLLAATDHGLILRQAHANEIKDQESKWIQKWNQLQEEYDSKVNAYTIEHASLCHEMECEKKNYHSHLESLQEEFATKLSQQSLETQKKVLVLLTDLHLCRQHVLELQKELKEKNSLFKNQLFLMCSEFSERLSAWNQFWISKEHEWTLAMEQERLTSQELSRDYEKERSKTLELQNELCCQQEKFEETENQLQNQRLKTQAAESMQSGLLERIQRLEMENANANSRFEEELNLFRIENSKKPIETRETQTIHDFDKEESLIQELKSKLLKQEIEKHENEKVMDNLISKMKTDHSISLQDMEALNSMYVEKLETERRIFIQKEQVFLQELAKMKLKYEKSKQLVKYESESVQECILKAKAELEADNIQLRNQNAVLQSNWMKLKQELEGQIDSYLSQPSTDKNNSLYALLETSQLELKRLNSDFMALQREKQTWNLLKHEDQGRIRDLESTLNQQQESIKKLSLQLQQLQQVPKDSKDELQGKQESPIKRIRTSETRRPLERITSQTSINDISTLSKTRRSKAKVQEKQEPECKQQ